jgi:hypothetical protein
MTVLDLIKRSMRLLSATNIGDAPTNEEAQDGLVALNGLIDSFFTQRLMKFSTNRTLYNLQSGKQVYLLGPAAVSPDWPGTRPSFIDRAGLILLNSDPSQVLEVPLTVLKTDAEWAAIRAKSITSDIPQQLYYDRGFSAAGAGQVALWPIPTASNQVALYTPAELAVFTALTQTISLPPAYTRVLAYRLAIELAAEFDREPPAAVVAIADEAVASLKRANFTLNILRPDGLRTRGGWDYQIGVER